MMEVSGPRIRNQRPQKPMYVFLWTFLSDFLQFNLQMTLNLIWWRSTDLGFKISDPKNLYMYFSGFFLLGLFPKNTTYKLWILNFVKGCLGWIGGMRVVRLGCNWLLIVLVDTVGIFSNFLGQKPALETLPLYYLHFITRISVD